MQKVLALFALFLFFGLPAKGQEIPVQEAPKPEAAKPSGKKKKPPVPTPKFEVNGGFLYRSYASPSVPRYGMNGWTVGIDYNRYRWIGLVGDFTGTYKNQGVDGDTSIYTFMGGPRVFIFGHRHRLIPYGQFLFGYGYENVSFPLNGGFPATSRTSSGYGYAGGAGVDYRFAKHWNFRIEFDYEKTHFSDIIFFTGGNSEGNYRFSAGFVYHWGERKNKSK